MNLSEENHTTQLEQQTEGPVLEWTVHPMTRRPWITVGVTLFIMVIGMLVFSATESKTFSVFALVVLYASLGKYYFPTSYRLTNDKIMVKTISQKLFKDWSAYRSFYRDKNGLLLSPFAEPSRLENFRGLYIMCRDNRDEVVEFVKARIEAAHADSQTTGDTTV